MKLEPQVISHIRDKRPLLYYRCFSLGTHIACASPNPGTPSSCLSQTCTTHPSCLPVPAPAEEGTLHSGTTVPLVPTSSGRPAPGRSRRRLAEVRRFPVPLRNCQGRDAGCSSVSVTLKDHWLWAQGEALFEKERGKADRVLWVCLLL